MYKKIHRCGIIVWINNLNKVYLLKKYGFIYYVSKKMKYVYLYVNLSKLKDTVYHLKKLKFVCRVQISKKSQLNTNYSNINSSNSN